MRSAASSIFDIDVSLRAFGDGGGGDDDNGKRRRRRAARSGDALELLGEGSSHATWCFLAVLVFVLFGLVLSLVCLSTPSDDGLAPTMPPMAGNGTSTPAPPVPCTELVCPYEEASESVVANCTRAGECDGGVCGLYLGAVCTATEGAAFCANASNVDLPCTCDACTCVVLNSSTEVVEGRACTEPEPSCCVEDPYVYAGSPYASASPTLCGTHDYNCDGLNDTLPCCQFVAPALVDGARTLYLADECAVTAGNVSTLPVAGEPDVCGLCNGSTVLPGWACEQPALRRKRYLLPCPEACPTELVEPSAETPPEVGECALFTHYCLPVHGGDGEHCCLVVTR